MPNPIKPVHEINMHNELFEPAGVDMMGISALQAQMMGIDRTAAKQTFSEDTISKLKSITENEDELLTATNVVTSKNNQQAALEKVFRAPQEITDYDLLNLKTSGLIVGQGRTVKLTEAGRIALRDKFLKSTNALIETRTKTEFVHPWRKSSADDSKFRKVEGD